MPAVISTWVRPLLAQILGPMSWRLSSGLASIVASCARAQECRLACRQSEAIVRRDPPLTCNA